MKYVLMALLFAASSAHGMIYTWKDAVGVAHYTNNAHEIPDRYRARAKALYPEAGDAPSAQKDMPVQQRTSEAQPPPAQQVNSAPPAVTAQPGIRLPEASPRRERRKRAVSSEE